MDMSNARQDKYCLGEESVAATNQVIGDRIVYSVGPHDVLMGRGAPITENPGNARLRQLVKERLRLPLFSQAMCQKDKHNVAVDIVNEIKARGGRFLRKHGTVTEGTSASNDRETGAASSSNSHLQKPCWIVVQDEKQIITKTKQLLRDMEPESMSRRLERRMYRYRKLGQPNQETKKDKQEAKNNPKSDNTESKQDKETTNNSLVSADNDLYMSTNMIQQQTLTQGNETRPHFLSTLAATSPPISTLNIPPLPSRETNSLVHHPLATASFTTPTVLTNQPPSISPALLAQFLQHSTAQSLAVPTTRLPPRLAALQPGDLSQIQEPDPYNAILQRLVLSNLPPYSSTQSTTWSEAISTPFMVNHHNGSLATAVNPFLNALGSTVPTISPPDMLPNMTSRMPFPSLRGNSPGESLSLQALVERQLALASSSSSTAPRDTMTVQAPQHYNTQPTWSPVDIDNLQRASAASATRTTDSHKTRRTT